MKTLRYLAVVAMVAAGCGNRSANLAEKDIVLNDTLSRSELVKMDVLHSTTSCRSFHRRRNSSCMTTS